MGLLYLFSEAVSCFDKVTTCLQGTIGKTSLIFCPVSPRPGLWSQAFLSSVSNLACGTLLCLPQHRTEWCRLSKRRGQNSRDAKHPDKVPLRGKSAPHLSHFQQGIGSVDNSFHFRVLASFSSSVVSVQNLHVITYKASILQVVLLCSSWAVPQALDTSGSERM
jgi:hypothetical protein